MGKVEQIAYLLNSEEWKSFVDIKRKCSLPEDEIKDILNFLQQYDFLQINNMTETFRLTPKLISLLYAR